MTRRSTILIVIGFLLLAGTIVCAVAHPWLTVPQPLTHCREVDADRFVGPTDDPAAFHGCLKRRAELFVKLDYAESKDLAKTFFTLIAAVLVASITFSEKIVDIHNARRLPLFAMFACWFALLLSICLVGAGVVSMTLAAGVATYLPQLQYTMLEAHAVLLFVSSTVFFGGGLTCLIVAGIVSALDKRVAAAAPLVMFSLASGEVVECDPLDQWEAPAETMERS